MLDHRLASTIEAMFGIVYRIRAYRTPLLIRTQGDTLWSFLAKNRRKNIVFSDDFRPKLTIVRGLKVQKFNKTPAFYLRGYGMYHTAHWSKAIVGGIPKIRHRFS